MLNRMLIGFCCVAVLFCVMKVFAFPNEAPFPSQKQQVNEIDKEVKQKVASLDKKTKSNEDDKSDAQATPSHNPPAVAANGQEGATALAVGDSVPSVEMESLNGEHINLSDYKGKTVVLNYFGSWCDPCKGETTDLVDFYNQASHADFVMFQVDAFYYEMNGKKDVEAFANHYHVPFTILLDKDKQFKSQFGVSMIPTTIIIDKQGNIDQVHIGPVSANWLKNHI
ncbi:hypothetical protein GCM10011391_15080 [Pullulanibacillus camelliae]|uniref:Thioredoxin domain-containing protein n=1 Tax=Pullulanibacillus camelliae TaxID=1707096 RepID=A0A8J2VS32_9BACL|nr:TlpA disulfide reductase family protein [Pullulanibacillus camelliae]GGE37160.1 hypothetical protein GCM10011391_15080 [Pullulanibacillus camelliae]